MTLKTTKPVHTPEGWNKLDEQTFTKEVGANTTATVTLRDTVGNSSITDVTYTVGNIDKEQPVLTSLYVEGDVRLVSSADVEVHFAGQDTGGSEIDKYQCQLNDGNWEDCTAPFRIPNGALQEGENKLKVRVIDNAGNTGDQLNPPGGGN